jgi:hypothetical protein
MARLLVGSEGTLAFFNEIELGLQRIPAHRVLGICHFPSFYSAVASTRRIVELGPAPSIVPHDKSDCRSSRFGLWQQAAKILTFLAAPPNSRFVLIGE